MHIFVPRVCYECLTARVLFVVGHSVETGEHKIPQAAEYAAAVYNPTLVKSLDDVKGNISDKSFQLLDARSPGRFNGTAPEPRPGAVGLLSFSLLWLINE